MPKVSVLLSVYNGAQYLRDALDSILSQTFENFEFVIVNDGSDDESKEIIRSYRDKRIRLIDNGINLGLVNSLNMGLAVACGEYIARMDADDISLPERFWTQVKYLDDNPNVGLVGTNCLFMNAEGKVSPKPFLADALRGAQLEWELYWGNPIVHPSVMIRSRILQLCGGYPTGYSFYSEDYALWLRLVRITPMCVLSQPLHRLRKHTKNLTIVDHQRHLNEAVSVVQSAFAERLGYKPSDASLHLIRGMSYKRPVSYLEAQESLNLLSDAFDEIAMRYTLDEAMAQPIKKDLTRRSLAIALSLAQNRTNRVDVIRILAKALCISPRLMALQIGARVGNRLTSSVKRVARLGTEIRMM